MLKRKGRELAVVMQARNQREEGREEMKLFGYEEGKPAGELFRGRRRLGFLK